MFFRQDSSSYKDKTKARPVMLASASRDCTDDITGVMWYMAEQLISRNEINVCREDRRQLEQIFYLEK